MFKSRLRLVGLVAPADGVCRDHDLRMAGGVTMVNRDQQSPNEQVWSAD